MAYYLYDGKNPIGPFEPAELVGRPGFVPTTLVFPAGATSAEAWKPASSFPDIAAALQPTAAAMPRDQRVEMQLTLPPQPPKESEAPSAVSPPAAVPASTASPEPAAAFAAPSDKLVIVITGSTLDDSTIKMIRQEANVVEFMAKPVRMNAFTASLHKHLKTAPR